MPTHVVVDAAGVEHSVDAYYPALVLRNRVCG
jgi:hypothetical protein